MQSIPYGRCCGFVDMVRCKIFWGCFSFHEIDVTALFRRNIDDLHIPDLFPLGDKKFFWHAIRSDFHLRSYETLAAD